MQIESHPIYLYKKEGQALLQFYNYIQLKSLFLLKINMGEDLIISGDTKEAKYKMLIPQIKSLIEGETNFTANCANIVAALKQVHGFFWVGFYFIKQNTLVLGPFQGEIACTRIEKGRGVCGAAWEQKSTIIVDDVDEFPGHIACSSSSKSEIVIPINKKGDIIGVLDVDSNIASDFDLTDKIYLEEIALIISNIYPE